MLQRELWRNTTIDVGYVANYGYDLLKIHVTNQVLSGDINGNGVDDRLEYARSQPTNAALRQFGVFGDTNIGVWDHTGESTYHSLQTQFISRFGRGSQVQASYTLSRSRANLAMTDSDGGSRRTRHNSTSRILISTGASGDGAPAHLQRVGGLAAPELRGRPALTRHLFGDWEIATIVGAGSGQPFTAFTGGLPGLNGGPSGTGYRRQPAPEPRDGGGVPGLRRTR